MRMQLIQKTTCGADIMTFSFKPMGAFKWTAGQTVNVSVPTALGREERWFTISSAPYETCVAITTRITESRFKQALVSLDIGTEVDVVGPSGNFTWMEAEQPKLLIAGGLGITPYRSMLLQRRYEQKHIKATLLAFGREDTLLFADEFKSVASATCGNLHINYVKSADALPDMIKHHTGDVTKYLVYVAGSESFVERVGSVASACGVSAENLMQDWFAGYVG